MNIVARFVLVALLGPAGVASAINCQISVQQFVFGLYQPGSPAPLDVTGQVNLRCTGTAGLFVATLSPGSSGTFAQRQMRFGPYRMNYNFYVNAARTTVWGDGTGGSVPSGGSKPRPGLQNFVLPIYGRVFPMQNVGAGPYSDNVLVTIIF